MESLRHQTHQSWSGDSGHLYMETLLSVHHHNSRKRLPSPRPPLVAQLFWGGSKRINFCLTGIGTLESSMDWLPREEWRWSLVPLILTPAQHSVTRWKILAVSFLPWRKKVEPCVYCPNFLEASQRTNMFPSRSPPVPLTLLSSFFFYPVPAKACCFSQTISWALR